MAELIQQEGNPSLALRVAVRPGGCSGFSYEMFFDTDIADDDLSSSSGGDDAPLHAVGQSIGRARIVLHPGAAGRRAEPARMHADEHPRVRRPVAVDRDRFPVPGG